MMLESGDIPVAGSGSVSGEERWIEAARKGDKAAFGRLVRSYQAPVYHLAYRMLGNGPEAEEAAQKAFVRAYRHLGGPDPQRPFSSWLFAIASHYCIDRLRRRRINWLPLKEEMAEPVQLASAGPNPEAAVTDRDREAWIQGLLDIFSPTDRAAVTLRYWYDCSYQEIAEVLDPTTSGV